MKPTNTINVIKKECECIISYYLGHSNNEYAGFQKLR